MTPEADALAKSVADYAIGFADRLTRARCKAFTDDERREDEIKAMMCLARIGQLAPALKAAFREADVEGRERLRDIREVS